MTYHRVDAGLARLLALGLEAELPKKVEEWRGHLAEGRITDEMRQVFVGLDWLSSMRDRRVQTAEVEEAPPRPRGRRNASTIELPTVTDIELPVTGREQDASGNASTNPD